MKNTHVLVVDDEVAILRSLKQTLTLEDYAVDVAGGFKLAEQRLDKTSYDLVLLDIALPDGNGLDLLKGLREAGNDTPVIMMSGHATIDAAVQATRLGAIDFLEKPLSTDRLLVVMHNTIRLVSAERETQALREAVGFNQELLGSSVAMQTLRDQIGRAARAQASVLVLGERGTGKELVARAIHRGSPRAQGPLEKLNCAAIPKDLIESELFGHEAGAFTGATKQRRGKFERASHGTLFLDEVGDMPLDMQAKLLRVLQEREIERVGGHETIEVDARIVAATNQNLAQMCESGTFRADLYDRLNVVPIILPPLRARREDIPELAAHFLKKATETNGRPGARLTDSAIEALKNHSWPGNVRELRNIIERMVILSPDDIIDTSEVNAALGSAAVRAQGLYQPGVPLRVLSEDLERTVLREALAYHQGQMTATARALGLERSHFYKKCKALGLRNT